MSLQTLGALIGGRPYLGQCWHCGMQFLSRSVLVARLPNGRFICEKCFRGFIGEYEIELKLDRKWMDERKGVIAK